MAEVVAFDIILFCLKKRLWVDITIYKYPTCDDVIDLPDGMFSLHSWPPQSSELVVYPVVLTPVARALRLRLDNLFNLSTLRLIHPVHHRDQVQSVCLGEQWQIISSQCCGDFQKLNVSIYYACLNYWADP